ncbi:methionyl-tRNA formyltransferase [Paenibacillus sp. UNC499MF]|uniref:methionyl-tRNA formyltransferase n=1 Tax=Paenibacillus sp. UNC499MF TaxID=1502751 RepID=UPI00089FAD53|nr:methionyl-tRNA formyltransferase [Paenibacillus sp. UNC499MF]SEF55674.1 methionyl-tRNA formyltransferase [Paenibacillus sp. UNC499MF]
MKLIFMGTPDFAVPSLRALIEGGYEVAAVVTQPDRLKGRKRVLTPPPVKVEAEKHGIPVFQPEKLRTSDTVDEIRRIAPDLIVTAAYGQILPKAVLDIPRLGCINIHASLLPKYRGGAPIHHAIIQGEQVTGVTIMYMAVGLDTGDMISKVEVPIGDDDTTGTMFDKLSLAGAELLKRTLPELIAGTARAVPQDDSQAIYSPNINREDEKIDWSRSSKDIWNLVRGLNPFPGAYTTWNGEILKVWVCKKPGGPEQGATGSQAAGLKPGTVIEAGDDGIEVATGDGSLKLLNVQPAGKKAMDAAQLARGGAMKQGTVLGE